MGVAQAKAEIDSAIRASLAIAQTAVQTCKQTISQSEVVSINNNCGSVKIGKIEFGTAGGISGTCLQTVQLSATQQDQITQNLKNAAQSVVGSLGLGVSDAEALTNASISVAQSISQSFSQTCRQAGNQQQAVIINQQNNQCQGLAVGQIPSTEIGVIDFNEIYTATSSCIMNDTAVASNINDVMQIIDNSASAKVEGIFGPIIFLLLIVGAIVVVVGMQGVKGLLDWRLWLVVIFATGIYFGLAFLFKWFPFKK